MDNSTKILVVAAWEPELVDFRRLAPEVPATPVGVGLVEAALGTARALVAHRPTHAVFLGTCGLYGGPPVPIITASRIVLAVPEGEKLPPPMPAAVEVDPALRDAFVAAGAHAVAVTNTVGVTIDDARAATRDGVEHLEAFAFARACAAAGVPCGVVLAVANRVGSRASEEWRANHASASAAAAALAHRALAGFRASNDSNA